MKRLLSVTILAAGLLSLPPTLGAQVVADPALDPGALAFQAPGPCSAWGLRALRGTYAFTATAWQDL
jgi:hypothetical protein